MGLWKKVKKKTNKGDLALRFTQRAMASKKMPKSIQKLEPYAGKLNDVVQRAGEKYADKYYYKGKSYIVDTITGKVNEKAGFDVAKEFDSPDVSSSGGGYTTTDYETTPTGLQPKVKGADETSVATSTLVLGALAVLFMASMMRKK